ncbi:MAG: response regulator [Ignavibacteriae bacterium]|nr:MAG: response regulator [Ignavibacteriota bacterium]
MLAIESMEMYLPYILSKNSMKQGSTILVVDDEDMHRLILKRLLEKKGYTVLDAANGAEGLEVMRTLKVDLAIVDLEMPVMDGLEFTRWVKDITPEFPVIIITAHAANFSPQDILTANVEAFIQKPIETEELLRTIEQI